MIITLEKDENGDLILPLGDELCSELGWKIGDTIKFINNGDGSWTMKKLEKELVLVECISTFRMRYIVEVPKGKKEWALDTVVCEEAEEFSQEHLGEQIVSHRVISDEEYLRIFDEDNDYLKTWNTEQKFQYITRLEDQESDDIEHSVYWYDTDRNK